MAVAAIAQTINYTYDEAGRLKSVTNTINETAEYVYDAAGNLTQIRRTAANVPAVTDFRPDSGPVGTVVTISGANFSATPASNTVRFNGTLASVSSASTTQLVTIVPTGATTGSVSVQTSAGTGTSFQSFTVTASGAVGAPTVSGFTPAVGLPNALVTISGTNFATAPGQTKVFFNQSLASIQSITTTSIVALVPAATGSGRIRVVTQSGTATSAADFIVPPVDQTLWPIGDFSGQVTRLVVGGSGSLNMTPPANTNRWGLYVFEGGNNAVVTLDFTALSTPPNNSAVEWEIRNVRNELMTSSRYEDPNYSSRNLGQNKRSLHVPPTAFDGTYAVFIRINNPTVSMFSSTVQLRADAEEVIDGGSVDFSTSFVGQTLRYFFNGTKGMTLGQALQGLVITPPNGGLSFDFRQPDWTTVKGSDGANGLGLNCQQAASTAHACGVDILALQSSGVHSVILYPAYPNGTTAASGKLWLSNDLTGTLPLNQYFDTPLFRVGQNGRFTFQGVQGQFLGATFSNVTFSPTGYGVGGLGARVRVLRSDGTELLPVIPDSGIKTGTGYVTGVSFPMLPADDLYTMFIDPDSAAGGSLRIRLWQVVPATISIGGSAVPVTLPAGQNGRVTFTAPSGGPSVGLAVTGLTYTPSTAGGALDVVIRRIADGVVVSTGGDQCAPTNAVGGRCGLNARNLVQGDYAIEITPPSASVVNPPNSTSFSLTLSNDVAGTPTKLNPGGAGSVALGTNGQNGFFTFDGLNGQRLGLAVSSLTVQDGQPVGVTVFRPDGTARLYPPPNAMGVWGVTVIDVPTLDVSGLHTIYVDPAYASTMSSATVTLSSDALGTLPINGASQSVTLNTLGQYANYDFTVSTAGQNLGLGLSNLSLTPPSGSATLQLEGGTSTDCALGLPANGCALNLTNMAVGSYRVLVKPPAAATGASFDLTLSPDVTAPKLTLGTPYNLTVGRRGQDARLTFDGVTGQNRRITVSAITTAPTAQSVRVSILRPDNYEYTSTLFSTAGQTFDLPNQTQTGVYTLWFDQDKGLTYNLTVTVTQY